MDFGVLEVIVGLGMAAFTITIARIEIVRTRRTRTSELYQDFYSSEHYRRVVLPVFRLQKKLEGMEKEAKEEYFAAILQGWEHDPEDPRALWEAMVPSTERELPPLEQHFLVENSTEAHTEHEALTSFLYFWVRAHRMIVTRLVDEKLFTELFCQSFRYYDDFLFDLRSRVEMTISETDEPGWVTATRHVQKLLKDHDCRS